LYHFCILPALSCLKKGLICKKMNNPFEAGQNDTETPHPVDEIARLPCLTRAALLRGAPER